MNDMNETDVTEVLIGLLRIIKHPTNGANFTADDLAIMARADSLVFLSDDACQYCGGRRVISDGTKCPECNGTGMRE